MNKRKKRKSWKRRLLCCLEKQHSDSENEEDACPEGTLEISVPPEENAGVVSIDSLQTGAERSTKGKQPSAISSDLAPSTPYDLLLETAVASDANDGSWLTFLLAADEEEPLTMKDVLNNKQGNHEKVLGKEHLEDDNTEHYDINGQTRSFGVNYCIPEIQCEMSPNEEVLASPEEVIPEIQAGDNYETRPVEEDLTSEEESSTEVENYGLVTASLDIGAISENIAGDAHGMSSFGEAVTFPEDSSELDVTIHLVPIVEEFSDYQGLINFYIHTDVPDNQALDAYEMRSFDGTVFYSLGYFHVDFLRSLIILEINGVPMLI